MSMPFAAPPNRDRVATPLRGARFLRPPLLRASLFRAALLLALLPGLARSSGGALSAQGLHHIEVTSPTMTAGAPMPRDYSPDGRNLSPPLAWRDLPAGTREIVVLCEDHGAGNPPPWVHWLIYNIPPGADGLPEGLSIDPAVPMPAGLEGATHGNNGWGLAMYRGPAPQLGNVHQYRFRVLALDTALGLPPGLTRAQVLERIEGHVIGEGTLVPIYERQPMSAPTELR